MSHVVRIGIRTPPTEPPFTTFETLLGTSSSRRSVTTGSPSTRLHTSSVRVGEPVHRGQILALVGNTGNPAVVPADPPRTRERQLPLDDDVIAFPPR